MLKKILFFFPAFVLSLTAAASGMTTPAAATLPADNPDAVVGIWKVGSGDAHVQIYKEGSEYFGKIVWLKEPNDENGKPKVDKNNPEEGKRNDPVLGMQMLRHFEYDEDNVWEDGEIYDPKSGKLYSCKMTLVKPNVLEVRGYIGISLIGRTDTWTRVE
ncbi:Uncharacterized conserved protein, DUF2147 family [Catalinimonas alkaloidigena]|uniref:Uncharacterized conserved protein, DUF2147 family n=1 Tax=Catalinimonas alkaloidigena TaxID=1075417 RepID=A0A1G8ZZL9_9BACT|nr:DUF2147 domain-containing protein [Catalinimonas alkaloidigena]SDK20556.1 Uncharacterized conserved protein, DUF2147 family [Catalinimonas alkaloidigena]